MMGTTKIILLTHGSMSSIHILLFLGLDMLKSWMTTRWASAVSVHATASSGANLLLRCDSVCATGHGLDHKRQDIEMVPRLTQEQHPLLHNKCSTGLNDGMRKQNHTSCNVRLIYFHTLRWQGSHEELLCMLVDQCRTKHMLATWSH